MRSALARLYVRLRSVNTMSPSADCAVSGAASRATFASDGRSAGERSESAGSGSAKAAAEVRGALAGDCGEGVGEGREGREAASAAYLADAGLGEGEQLHRPVDPGQAQEVSGAELGLLLEAARQGPRGGRRGPGHLAQ